MRKITEDAIRAFLNGRNFKRGNTQVKVYSEFERYLLLHGNVIAILDIDGLFITSAGWETSTTKERLNGFSNVRIHQTKYQWFLNGEAWDGGLTKIHGY